MPWVDLTKADQAIPGARMRRKKPFRMRVQRGRPSECRVIRRGKDVNFGLAIYFDDGSLLKISDAKNTMEIFEE